MKKKTRIISTIICLCVIGGVTAVAGQTHEAMTTMKTVREYMAASELLFQGDAAGCVDAITNIQATGKRFSMSNKIFDPVKDSRAWGIAAGIVSDYFKVRTYVRLVYDEIKLWGSLVKKYNDVKDYIEKMGKAYAQLFDHAGSLFTENHGLLPQLQKIVDFNEEIEAAKRMPKTLDSKIARLEKTWDTMTTVNKTYTYTIGGGMLSSTVKVPDGGIDISSGNVLKYVDNLISDSNGIKWLSKGVKFSSGYVNVKDRKPTLGIADTSQEIKLPQDRFRKYALPVESNKIVISQAMAGSLAYRQWAQAELERLGDVDEKIMEFIEDGGINGVELAAAWYSIMNVNANNKKMLHAILEAKLLSAMLGTEAHKITNVRAAQFEVLKGGIKLDPL